MNTKYIRSITAVFMGLFMCACVSENLENQANGGSERTGVYFLEEQENIKTHTLEKGVDATSLNFIVRRSNTDTRERVPFSTEVYYIEKEELTDTSTIEVVKPVEGVFFFSDLVFEEGESETIINVRFDMAKTGVTYTCNMEINDPRYISPYDYKASSVSFSVQVYEWSKIPQKALLREGFLSDMFVDWKGRYIEKEVEIHQRKDKAGYYRLRNVYNSEFIARLVEGDEEYENDPDGLKNKYSSYVYNNHYLYLDATDPEKVYFPAQITGFVYASYGDIIIASDVEEVFGSISNQKYGTLVDNVITFPKNSLNFGMGAYYYFGNTEGKFRIVLPGGDAKDYGIDLEVEEVTPEGKMPVNFDLDEDVAYVKYAIFEGKIAESEIGTKVDVIKQSDDKKCAVLQAADAENTQEITLNDEFKTGIHTLVACTYDSENNFREYDYAYLGYVTAEDNEEGKGKVELKIGIHTDDLYESEDEDLDYNSTNSFQYWIRGKDITHVQISYYPTDLYNAYKDVIQKKMKEAVSLGSDYLKVINSASGLGGILGNQLKAGTSYSLVVYAENGFHGDFFEGTVTLEGTAESAQKTYFYTDIDAYTQDIDAYTQNRWVPVSVDIFDEESKGRVIRGKKNSNGEFEPHYVTFRREGEQMIATGLFPTIPPSKTKGPEITFDIKENRLVLAENDLDKVYIKDSTNIVPSLRFEYLYEPKPVSLSYLNNSFYENYEDENEEKRYDFLRAGFVADGVIAFTDNQTENVFMTMTLGGFQESQGEDVFSTIIGDGHGELILVKEGHPMLDDLLERESEDVSEQIQNNPASEMYKYKWNEVDRFMTIREKIDIAYDMLEFKVESRARIQ